MHYFRIILFSFSFVLYSCNPDEDVAGSSDNDVPDIGESLSYSLKDVNPNSETYNNTIGPDSFENMVTIHYFGHQT